ncbi:MULTISPECIES: hypothetical protein [Bacteroidota]|uniref:Uncharacterized protein n=1 Tax=Flectobacillus rivi TaxID=2984209 RepID=A0ABT6Z565_9BACT|nr:MULTISPECIES: hypothetical protein [Bacteroidota]MDI9876271.1 hypothetical protein [Flectobacillus rivi]MDI9878323.1 hypothetical protein [Flectobacillus longus]NBB30792.1 hypothetical protein [Cellulophaga sp. BC115SP]
MKKLIVLTSFVIATSVNFESLAIGFPHNLLAPKKTEKKVAKETKTKSTISIAKLKEKSKLVAMGATVLGTVFQQNKG